MSSSPDSHEQRIIRSWHANAEPWSEAIRAGSIASRAQPTDRAVLDANAPLSVLFSCRTLEESH